MAELEPVYLISGSDRPKIRLALERLRNRFDDGAIEALHADEASGEDVVAACNALGLFGSEHRLVLVEDVDVWKAPDAKAIAEYLKSPTPETVLALVGDEIKKESALAKACAKAGDVLVYDAPRKRDLPKWVARQFEQLGAKVEGDAAALLIEIVGDDADGLRAEIEKLATWAGGETVTRADVESFAAPFAEGSTFALTDAWGARDVAGVLGAAERLLERSGQPRRDAVPRLVGLLVSHVGRVEECRRLAAEGVRARDAAAQLRRSPFYVQKLFAQAENFSDDELADAIVRLAELDHALKGGSRLAPDLELERALVEITRRAEARAAR